MSLVFVTSHSANIGSLLTSKLEGILEFCLGLFGPKRLLARNDPHVKLMQLKDAMVRQHEFQRLKP